jgi:23S rRNA (pseudouridine1915-N3)-methyltransferase
MAREDEGRRILAAIPGGNQVIALDVGGRSWSTQMLAEQMQKWMQGGRNLSLLVGGPDGLSLDCLQRAEQRWSLSDLTMPHTLVRVLLAEQLYRAWTVISGHPYHRA